MEQVGRLSERAVIGTGMPVGWGDQTSGDGELASEKEGATSEAEGLERGRRPCENVCGGWF